MLTEYVARAQRHAHYEIMENGRYWGEIPELQGVWAEGEALEQCRETLREGLGRLAARGTPATPPDTGN